MADTTTAAKIQSTAAFKTFVRALPEWARRHGGLHPTIIIQGTDDGAEVSFSFPAEVRQHACSPEDLLANLMEHLSEESRLMEMEILVDEFRGVGVLPEVIDPMLVEANRLLRQQHPLDVASAQADTRRG